MEIKQLDKQDAIKNKTIQQVAILGQGTMGVDIALTFAIAGYEVTALDHSGPFKPAGGGCVWCANG